MRPLLTLFTLEMAVKSNDLKKRTGARLTGDCVAWH